MKKYSIIILIVMFGITQLFSDPRSPEWEHVRKAHLENHPVCELCGTAKDLQVHHIKPFHLSPELELDPDNLVTLCISKYWGFSCHILVGHGGNSRYENPWVKEDITIIKILGDPQYIKEHGEADFEEYVSFMKKRVKEYNLNRQDSK